MASRGRDINNIMKHRKKLGIEMGRVSAEEYKTLPESGIVVVLDNVRSAHNVGSVFRSADSFKADRLVLCGICATPPSAEIHKSALGAEFSVEWEHYDNTMDAIAKLHAEGYEILCVEQAVDSIMLDRFTPVPGKRYALVFGNEVDGVAQEVIEAADGVIEITQYGTKHSLNISVTAGIILWHFRPRQENSI